MSVLVRRLEHVRPVEDATGNIVGAHFGGFNGFMVPGIQRARQKHGKTRN